MQKIKLSYLVLVGYLVSLVISAFPTVASASSVSDWEQCGEFNDINPSISYCWLTKEMRNWNIFTGDFNGNFRPNDPISRAEIAKVILVSLYGNLSLPTATSSDLGFNDLYLNSQWFYSYLKVAKQKGIIGGYPDGTFRPSDNVSRAEFAKMLFVSDPDFRTRFNKLYGTLNLTQLIYSQLGIEQGAWYSDYVLYLYMLDRNWGSYLNNCNGGGLCPAQPITRLEVAAALDKYWRDSGKNLGFSTSNGGSSGSSGSTGGTGNTGGSSGGTVTLTAPTLIAPASGTAVSLASGDILFQWNSVPNANRYYVQVWSNGQLKYGDNTYGTTVQKDVQLSWISPQTGMNNYTWYVTAYDANGNMVNSAQWNFTINQPGATQTLGTPVLSSPGNGTTVSVGGQGVTFSWNATSAATNYTLMVSFNGDTWVSYPGIGSTQWTVPASAFTNPAATIRWKVQAFDANNNSTTSAQWAFAQQNNTLGTATLVSPTNGTTLYNGNQSVTFKWNAANAATKYTLMVSFNGDTWVSYTDVGNNTQWTVPASAFNPIVNLSGNNIRWKVQAFDVNNNTTMSAQWSFTVSGQCGPPNACY